MPTITRAELAEKLRTIKGATPLTISALVKVKTNKKDRVTGQVNPFTEVLKLSRVNGMTAADYEAAVNRQREREGSIPAFEAKERQWGIRVAPALVEHNGAFYLPIHPRSARTPIYFGRLPSGVLIQVAKEKVEPYLPPKRDAGDGQDLVRGVEYRNYGLAGIASATMQGETWRVRG